MNQKHESRREPNTAALARINALLRKQKAARENYTAELAKDVGAVVERAKHDLEILRAYGNKIAVMRRALPKTKYDLSSGEYFFADAAGGKQKFRIALRSIVCKVVEVEAADEAEAIQVASGMAEEAFTEHSDGEETIEAECVCRS